MVLKIGKNMELIKKINELNKDDTAIAGGKGASLGEMTQAGIPVPQGFVVLSSAFERFLEETDLIAEIDAILHTVNKQEVHTAENASEKIQALILNAQMPSDIANEIETQFELLGTSYVAVRSSATAEDSASAAWAGQLESYLNTTSETLLKNVQRCWASLFTPRAIFYRFEKELHTQKISVAVVVQKMVESELSGIAFSVHPVTEDRNQLIIEAGYGLGEAIVAGQITPDSYVVEKEPRRVIDANVNNQKRGLYRATNGGNEWRDIGEPKASTQVLMSEQILELAELVILIENHYGFPCDVEWAYESGKFYIVQSRPITTLGNTPQTPKDSNTPSPQNYIRMFANKSFAYLFSSIFLKYYDNLGVASIADGESWMSFLPKSSHTQTLKDGAELYTSEEKYRAYKTAFDDYRDTSAKQFEKWLTQPTLNTEDVEKFLILTAKHFSFYSKTEFFYTDAIDPNKMVISVQEFDELKLSGRAWLNRIMFEDEGYTRRLTKRLSKECDVPESEILYYEVDEVIELVRTSTKVSKKTLTDRTVFFSSVGYKASGDAAREVVDSFFASYRERAGVIKGTIAYKGKVRAKARVLIPDFNDFDKIKHAVADMEKGEVLVAETTAPEIILACQKASAIVTNQGGMLSHAAIVSRELKIPCIIGTDKDVILNIQTGDELEVDADKGVIRIISKAQRG